MDYWKETVVEALNEAGLTATDQQVEVIAEYIKMSSDNYDLYSGNDIHTGNRVSTLLEEVDTARRRLHEERDKTTCKECAGRGTTSTTNLTRCWKCNGEGRHKP